MGQVLVAFGIDWRLLVIDLINFGLLMLALWYFLYGPLVAMLKSRREKIAQSVEDAENAAQHLKEIQENRASMLADAGKEADTLVANARAAATAKQKELIGAGETAAANALKEAESQAIELKNRALAESKEEVAKMIVLGMEKLALKK